MFPQYASYLDSYCSIWLGSDLLENFAASAMPSMKSQQEFTLELTPEQAEAFADGRYYILQREGDELYTKIFSSGNVTISGTTLIANFDGQVIYARDGLGDRFLPVAEEHDTVGDLTRYSIYVNLSNFGTWASPPEGVARLTEGYRFHLSANGRTKEISTAALVPWSEEVQLNSLLGGRLEDADLSQWVTYTFPQEPHRYLSRYENGAIKPVDQWPNSDFISGFATQVGDGLEFYFDALAAGEYYLVFEVEDTQGSLYCSDLLPITVEETPDEDTDTDFVEVTWDSGSEVFLTEQEGVRLYLTTAVEYTGYTRYALKAENSNGFDVRITTNGVAFDSTVWCEDGFCSSFSVPAGGTAASDPGFYCGEAADLGMVDDHSSFQFFLKCITADGRTTLINNRLISVNFSAQTVVTPQHGIIGQGYYRYDTPARGILAGEQLLCEKDGLKITLLGFGGKGGNSLYGGIRFENTGTESRYVKLEGANMDGIFVECGTGPVHVPGGMVVYQAFSLDEDMLEEFRLDSVSSMAFLVRFMEFYTLEGGGGFSELEWHPVTLTERGGRL